MHTNASDGIPTPEQLLQMVRKANLTTFSVTDHDTIAGLVEVESLLASGDPNLISGVELSVSVGEDDMHMLAYGFDSGFQPFQNALLQFQTERSKRGEAIVERLNQLGIPIPFSEVRKSANGAVIGRPHISDTLIRLGYARTTEEVFRKYIGYNGPAYVPKATWKPADAIDLVHQAGGIAVMAHPFLSNMQRHIAQLVPLGLDGVEAFHYTHTKAQSEQLQQIASSHDLIITGGSDYHGRTDRDTGIGSQHVSDSIMEQILARTDRYRKKVKTRHEP